MAIVYEDKFIKVLEFKVIQGEKEDQIQGEYEAFERGTLVCI